MKLLAVVAALVLVSGGVLWWALERPKGYCDQVAAHTAAVQAGQGAMQNLVEGLPELEELGGAAPSDLKDEWQVLVNAVRGFRQAFDDTGVDPSAADLAALPDSVTAEQRQRIKDAASVLVSAEVKAAVSGIEQQALDVCHTPLQL